MDKGIRIRAGGVDATAELNDTGTAQAIWGALPIKGHANTWGDEIYFSIPVSADPENAQELVEVGDLGYWPPGKGFCIFFGRTPMSEGDKPRPASPVNVFGRVISFHESLFFWAYFVIIHKFFSFLLLVDVFFTFAVVIVFFFHNFKVENVLFINLWIFTLLK